jgi:hypothetical protein
VTTNTIAKKYPFLSADERFSLLLAASARGDEVEVNRLAQSATPEMFKVSDLFGRSQAFVVVSMIHRLELLNLAAFFFKTTSIADSATGESASRCHDSARLFGYLMNIHAEAWLEFCQREQLASSIGTDGLPGEELLQKALEESRLLGFSQQAAQDYAKRPEVSISQIKTMMDVADDLQETYKLWVAKWE